MNEINALRARANAGDAAAQYRLAAMLAQAGDAASAKEWLEKAAASGHPGAIYTRATELLSGPPAHMAPVRAADMLREAVEKGGLGAARQLAALKTLGLGAATDRRGARALLAKAAAGGHPAAMREAAALAIMAGRDAAAADILLRTAALKGDWIAAVLALRRGGIFTDAEAQSALSQLRQAGAPLLDRHGPPAATATQPRALRENEIAALLEKNDAPAPSRKVLRETAPRLVAYEKALTPLECDYVICAAAPLLTPSAVVDPRAAGARQESFRTSDGCAIGVVDLDLVLFAIWEKLCDAVGALTPNSELMGVLRYRPGQEYRPHHDYLPEDEKDYSEVRRAGQRAHTLLVYLNDGFAGGETIFPRLGLSFRGRAGDALYFQNTDETGVPIEDSQHAGAAVSAGEKWMLTLWIRQRRFWFWK
ncbi:prolyl hydroxylase family protein [Amphiplicatus metriothermophilus]|uniref:Prolyl 4-hydroxylase n=1 Tax=Amphiplicatus metriothermophilus TaxID=1519374 RepID=A0A239PKV3_9PROT|nr:2OG-Fe(II) oxygenase [Amphiplicatus metriothermophilus]MBB5517982.1 prolyl 4-hydroxylase [Amphiplicatus metriothermophilus]SNT67684.1 prolyl 4-hydroxylase [Amphiplicatus metriothermophilus]